jgi:hypothetical protein
MRIHQVLNVLVLAAAMHSIGCAVDNGSDEKTSAEASDLTGGVPTGVRCSNKAWTINFLDDATHTIVVGTMSCTCFGPELLAGVESNFSVLVRERDCDFN